MDAEVSLSEIDLSTVKKRSVSAILTLISRSFILQIVSTLGFLLLTIYLGRPEIGIFIAVNDLISILGYFSDVGLAASLIQKKDKVSLADLRTAFTLQQILVLSLVLISLVSSPLIFSYYHISEAAGWLFYSLLFAFFLASLKTIPSVMLERHLNFSLLAAIEVVETVAFYVVAVAFAYLGYGVMAYALAVFIRAILGVVLIYLFAPWPIGLSVSRSSVRKLMSFGIQYQLNTILAVIKDRFLNILLWRYLGADGVGIIGWAQTWSQKPLRFVMDNVTKVTFPSFSRMQDHPQELRQGIETTLRFIALITFPSVAGIALLATNIVMALPQYSKWTPALVPLSYYCFSAALAAISTPLTNTLNALGRVRTNTYLMLMWTILTWTITPYLASRFGYHGVAISSAVIGLSSFVPVYIVHRMIKFNIFHNLVKPGLATALMIIFYRAFSSVHSGLLWTSLTVTLSVLWYCLLVYFLYRDAILADVRKIYYAFKTKR